MLATVCPAQKVPFLLPLNDPMNILKVILSRRYQQMNNVVKPIFGRFKLEEEDQAPSDPNSERYDSRSGNNDYDAVDGVSSALSFSGVSAV